MAPNFRLPILALTTISFCLSIAIIGCAGRPLHVFNSQQSSNIWFLPVWPNHFDTRELKTLIGTSAVILVLNGVLAVSVLVHNRATTFIPLVTTALSLICAIVAIAFPATLNSHAPTKDTLQTWTCRWSHLSSDDRDQPEGFSAFCHETRFAFYASIPLFLLQLALLSLAVLAHKTHARQQSRSRLYDEPEKGQTELGDVGHVAVQMKH